MPEHLLHKVMVSAPVQDPVLFQYTDNNVHHHLCSAGFRTLVEGTSEVVPGRTDLNLMSQGGGFAQRRKQPFEPFQTPIVQINLNTETVIDLSDNVCHFRADTRGPGSGIFEMNNIAVVSHDPTLAYAGSLVQ